MIDKIKLINQLLKQKQIKAEKLESIKIPNLIFSLNNVDTHYITTDNRDTWYCYKMYQHGLPKDDSEIVDYCSQLNLHRSLHDNDYKRRVKLICGVESSIDELLKYLNDDNERGLK